MVVLAVLVFGYIAAVGIVLVVAPLVILVGGWYWVPTFRRWRLAGAILAWLAALCAFFVIREPNVKAAAFIGAFIAEAAVFAVIAFRQPRFGRRTGSLAAVPILSLLLGPFVLAYAAPVAQYDQATVRCGHQPVIALTVIALDSGEREYQLPGDASYAPSLFTEHYFCTAAEAEGAGYSRNADNAP